MIDCGVLRLHLLGPLLGLHGRRAAHGFNRGQRIDDADRAAHRGARLAADGVAVVAENRIKHGHLDVKVGRVENLPDALKEPDIARISRTGRDGVARFVADHDRDHGRTGARCGFKKIGVQRQKPRAVRGRALGEKEQVSSFVDRLLHAVGNRQERTLVAAGYAPDRLTVDLNQFQRVSKFFDLAVERLDETEFNEELIDQEADPVGWRQQQIRIRRLKAAKRARAALSEPPYHAVFLAMDAKTASLVRSRLPIRSRIWGTPIINPGDPKTDPQAKAMTYDLLQVALVDSPLVLQFDADEFEDIYRVPAPQTSLQKRLFALGADAFAAASSIAHGTTSASFDGLLGTVAYNLSLSPKAERRGQTAMIFGGELRIMDENAVVEYESFKTNSRRMRAQARSLERLQREAQQAARKAGTLIEETSDNAPRLDDMLDSYNFSGGSSAQPAAEPEPVTMPMMKGKSFKVFLPYTEQTIVTASVPRPQRMAR